jgi:hypothetical protein
MLTQKKIVSFVALLSMLTLFGCAASTDNVGTLTLPTSGKQIDVVQHRSSSKDGCTELVVLQTYSASGGLIDSQAGRGTALPCQLLGATIEAGAHVGAAAIIADGASRAAKAAASASNSLSIGIDNVNGQSQGQVQGQAQLQGQKQSQGQSQLYAPSSNPSDDGHGDKGGHGW